MKTGRKHKTTFVVAATANRVERRRMTCNWDGEEGAVAMSKLTVVDVGEDSDGDKITSCVIEPVENAVVTKGETKKKRPFEGRQDENRTRNDREGNGADLAGRTRRKRR